MELSIQTPALLFPAISLLMLAFTNKFLAIASLIRKLYSDYEKKKHNLVLHQIASLRRRLVLIRWMQALGIASTFFCVLTMFFLYEGWQLWAKILFSLGLLLMLASLVVSLVEIFLSAGALNVLLRDLEEKRDQEEA
jgi:small-conductance mechanosensitive channel